MLRDGDVMSICFERDSMILGKDSSGLIHYEAVNRNGPSLDMIGMIHHEGARRSPFAAPWFGASPELARLVPTPVCRSL